MMQSITNTIANYDQANLQNVGVGVPNIVATECIFQD